MNAAFHSQIHLWENIIQACWRQAVLVAGLTNPLLDISSMINLLCSSIINYKTVHEPSFTQNYVQSDDDEKDDKMFFTNCQYQQDRHTGICIKEHLICLRVYLIYLVYPHFVFYLGQKYFNISKGVLCAKNLAVGLVITFNKSEITWKRSLVIVIPSIKSDSVMSGTYNTKSLNMKMLTIINT